MSTAVEARGGGRTCTCESACKCDCSKAHANKDENEEVADAPRAACEGGGKVVGARSRTLFEDEKFSVEELTLAGDVPKCVVWKRPHELCENPQVFVDGASRLDVLQGERLGDCWLIAACSALAEHPELVRELIPDGLELKPGGSENKYTGKVTINLWSSGSRFPIVIDDRLPVMNTKLGLKLVYGTCKETSEFWLPLVEKAVAKYQGGYRKLRGRQIPEGLMILTGYSVNRISLINHNYINNLYKFLKEELKRKSLIIAAGKTVELVRISRRVLTDQSNCEESAKDSDYHSYTVNKVLKLSKETRLIRIRNPWGTEANCTGKFRISNDLLKSLPKAIVDELTLCPCSDGEYWVDENGFYQKFEEMCIANEYPSVSVKKLVPSTNVVNGRGKWEGKTIGGSPGSDTYGNNCQFLFQVDVEDKEAVKGNVPVLLELIQDLHRKNSIPFESGMTIHKLKKQAAAWQTVGAAGLQRYSLDQLENGAEVLSPCSSGGPTRACAARVFFELAPASPHVAVAWAKPEVTPLHFLLRVYSPAGVVVRLSTLPEPR